MIATDITQRSNARMNRIQKASKCVRVFLQYGIPLMVVGFMIYAFSAAAHNRSTLKQSPPALPFALWQILGLVVYLFWYRTALKLFGFFEKGILFTAETVRCIQILGGIYIARFLVQSGNYFFSPLLNRHSIGLSDLFTGFLIIFIGWLIDEARKIREEQALTV